MALTVGGKKDMQVNGPAHLHGAQPINAPHAQRQTQQAPRSGTPIGGDQLELSDTSQLASRLADIPDIRQDRVSQIRAEIASGSYDSDEKLSAALDSLLDEIG